MMLLAQWSHDLRLAVRGLLRARGFTGTAVLTLALGIAGTTVMFALVEGVLLRPLPVWDPDRLVVAWKELRSEGFSHWPISRADIEAIGDGSRLLERVAGVDYNGAGPAVAVEDGSASHVRTANVTGAFFGVLGVEPVLGRALDPADDTAGAENVLVITHDLWQRRYGGSPDVIGRRLILGEHAFRIVGVMLKDVAYPRGVEAWNTVAASASTIDPIFREAVERELDLVARLRPGVTLEQARGELQGLIASLEADAPPGGPRGSRAVVRSYTDAVVGDTGKAIVVLFAAVGLVLLIGCANVANLLLLRGEARRAELAVRAALGAGPGRLARQMLAESLVLALAAGVVGLAVAWWALQALVALVPDGLPRVESVRIDAAVVLFTLVAAFVAAALAAVAPAVRSARVDLVSSLRGGRQVGYASGVQRGRRALVVGQVALAVTVVAAAGLLARSLLALQTVEMGLAAERLVFVPLALPQAKYADRARHLQFLDEVVARLESAPGIDGATPVNTPPYSGTGGWDTGVYTMEGQTREQAQANPQLSFEAVHPGYFATLEVPLVRGRAFTEKDRAGAPEVAIVSEDVAARAWPGLDPIGRRLKLGDADLEEPCRTVVGVVKTTRYRELVEPRPTLYLHRRGAHSRAPHGLAPGTRGEPGPRDGARRGSRRAGPAGGALRGGAPGTARAATLQCVPDRGIRPRRAGPRDDRAVRGDGCLRAPALRGARPSRRPRRDPVGRGPARPRGRAAARRLRRRDRAGRRRRGDSCAARPALRRGSPRSRVDRGGRAAPRGRGGVGFLSARTAGHASGPARRPADDLKREAQSVAPKPWRGAQRSAPRRSSRGSGEVG